MNCNTYKNQIMLDASNELDAKYSNTLQSHLQNCRECRDFAETMNVLTDSYSKSNETPHPAVMVNIRQAAEDNLKTHQLLWFPTHTVRLLAYAAILVFIAGTTLITIKAPNTKNEMQAEPITHKSLLQNDLHNKHIKHQATRISELSTMVTMLSDNVESDEYNYIIEDSASLEAFAEQLLEMQGFAVDNMFDDEAMLNLLAEPDPTTTQYRNIRGLPAKTHV